MKKILTLLFAFLAMTFCVKAQTLLSESFDSGTLPTGWTAIDSDGDGFNWQPVTGENLTHSGAGCIASASYDNDTYSALTPDNWLITPAVNLTGDATLTFWVVGQDPDYCDENYSVYISTTGNSVSDFTTVLTTGTATASYVQSTVDLSSYTGETVYIAFRHHNTTDMFYLNLDDVKIFAIPTGPTIDIVPSALTFSTTLLGDTAFSSLNITSYNLTSDISVTSTAPFEISADGSIYDYYATLSSTDDVLYVRYIPTVGGTDNGVISFTSGSASTDVTVIGTCLDCSNITLPLAQSFESVADLSCWSALSANTENPLSIVTGLSTQGNASFRFSSYTSASDYNQYLITPELPDDVAKMVTFDYKGDVSYGTENFKVGYSTTTNDISEFIWDSTITKNGGTPWEQYLNAAFPAEAKYIAINYFSNYAYYLYIDNFVVTEVTDCMAPIAVTASNVNQNSAQINWNPVGLEESWTVAVVEQGDDPDNASSEYVDVRPYLAENLMPNTTYEVYVKAECETGSSPWSVAGSFTTTPDCSNPSNPQVTNVTGTSAVISWTAAPYGVTSYYVEYGEAESGSTEQVFVDSATTVTLTGLNPETDYEFTITSDCNSATITPTPVTGTFTTDCLVTIELAIGNGTATNNYFPVYTLYKNSYSQQIFLASELEGPRTISSVSFNMSDVAQQRNYKIYLMHTSLSTSNSWIPADSAQLCFQGSHNFVTGWNKFDFSTPFQYNGTDNLVLIIVDNNTNYVSYNKNYVHDVPAGTSHLWYSDSYIYNTTSTPGGTSYSTTTYRNNVKFGAGCDPNANCIAPIITDLTYTANEATITWSPGYQESAWNLQYKVANDTAWIDEGSVTSPYTILNLLADEDYELRLYSDCGSEMSSPAIAEFTTPCATIIPPYTETFAGWNTAPSVCWSRYSGLASSVFAGGNLTSTTSGWNFSSSNVFSLGHPKVNVYSTDCKYWLVSPSIDLSNMINPELTFDLALTDYGNADPIENPTSQQDDKFMVIVSTDNGQTWSQANATVWDNQGSVRVYNNISYQGEEVSVSLAQYVGQTIKIAFYAESTQSGGDNDLHFANVSIDEAPSCSKPIAVILNNASSSSLEFSWIPYSEESAWEYLCVPQGITFDFDNAQWESAYDTFAVATGLNPNTLYTIYVRANCDNGDQSEAKTLDARTACGEISIPFYEGFESYSTGSSVPMYCWTRSNNYSSTSNYPYVNTTAATGSKGLYFYGSTSNYNLIATPAFESTVDLSTVQVSFNMYVGNTNNALVVGAMTDPNDLTSFVGVDTLTLSSASTWEYMEVPMSSYTGTGSYIAFKFIPGTSYTSLNIDDLSIDLIPSCPRPTHLTAQSTATDTVILNWTDDEGNLWDVIYGPTGFDPLTSTDAVIDYGITTTTYAVTGLAAGVVYDFYVRRDCGNGDVSPWNAIPTSAAPYTVLMGVTGSSSITACGMTIADDGGLSGKYSNSCDYTLTIYPSDPDSLISISGTFTGEGTADYLSVYQGTTVDEANLIQKVTAGSATVNVGPFTSELGPMTLKFHSDGSIVYDGFVINANCVSAASCRKPAYFTAVGSTSTSATLAWTELGTATTWNVAYGAPGFDPDNADNIEYAFDTTHVVNNLTAGTTYEFYVKADCGGETSEWAGPISITPGTYNMPVTGNETITMCGGIIYDNGGANGNYSNNCDAHLTVNPETPTDLVSISGTLTAESASWDYLIIYDGDGTTELYHSSQSSGTPVTFGPIESTTGPLVVYFHSDGSTNYAGFALNVTCTPAPTCRKPLNFTVDGTTTTDAILSWNELGTATQWNIEYGPAGFTPGQGATVVATTNPYTVTGLTTATAYDFYVQADCGDGDVSEWSSVASATTDCDVIATFPFTENFDASTSLPDCWNNVNVTGSTEWEVSTPDEGSVVSAHSGNNAVIFFQDDEGDQADLQMPTFDLTSLTNPVLTFWYTNESWSGDIDELTVYYRTSAVDTWTQLTSHTSGVDTWTFDSLALPNPSANYQIKFHATSNYGYGINIDDVTIMEANDTPGTTCDAPTNVAASNIAQTSATITWTAGGDETAWNLQYKATSSSNWSNNITVNNTPSYALAGLTANTAYQVRVQAVCDANNVSDWANGTFTTLDEDDPTCPAPTNVAANDITKNSAVITWSQEPNTASSWSVLYKQSAASTWETATANTMSYTLSGLNANTQYDVQVMANCDNDMQSSASETIHFTTLIDGVNDYVLDAAISVYPNPTSGQFTIYNEQCTIICVDVYDVYGKLISTTKVEDTQVTLDINTIADGVYFARILTDKGVVTKRIVKK